MISAEIFAVERGLTWAPLILSSPFINITCYILVGLTVGWWYSLSTFLLWVVTFILQHLVVSLTKPIKVQEGYINDRRITLVHEILTGIKTIKAYCWEKLFQDKISKIRGEQIAVGRIIRIFVAFCGAILQNSGFIAIKSISCRQTIYCSKS